MASAVSCETASAASCEVEEPWWGDGFLDDLDLFGDEEAAPEILLEKNPNLRGDEGWKQREMDLLGDLRRRVTYKKSEELREVHRDRMTNKSGIEENGLTQWKQSAITFREFWNSKWHGSYGSFEDITLIHSMKYTYRYAPPLARPCDSLQIFSAKFMGVTGLKWPLHVFGMVAVRDLVDRNRNLVFYRTRDNCQTLNEADPYLVLTGPSRTVVLAEHDPVIVEIYLKVKGTTENEDENLLHYVDQLSHTSDVPDDPADNVYPFQFYSKLGSLSIIAGIIRSSVEATVFVRVVKGSWPDGFHGHFAAWINSGCNKVVLFDFGADKVPVDGNRYLKFSCQVVSVNLNGSLKVYCMAWPDDKSFKACQVDNEILDAEVQIKPEKAGRSYASLRLGSCVMEVLVAWSLVLPEPQPDVPDSLILFDS